MSVSAYTFTITQTATFSHANSGYAATNAGPTQNSFSDSSTSGKQYFNQVAIANTSTQSYDFASGGLKDLVGDVCNYTSIYGLTIQPFSGAVQVETTQSGGMAFPQLGLSGGGFLVNPGAIWGGGDGLSGYQLAITATKGNLVLRAVSGNCLASIGCYGI